MLKRILTGIVAFCFVLVPVLLFADTAALPIGIAVFAMIATYEILHCVGLHKNLWLSAPMYLMSAAVPFGLRYLADGILSLVPAVICLPLLISLAVAVFSHGKADIRDVSSAFVLWLYTIVGFMSLIYMHDFITGGRYFYLLAFIGAWVTDTFAYFTGMLLGKHKLIPDVSPKKTVEGAVGGIVFCVLAFVGFGLLYNNLWLLEGDTPLPLWLMATVGLLVSSSPRSGISPCPCSSASTASRTSARSSPATAALWIALTRFWLFPSCSWSALRPSAFLVCNGVHI